MKAQSTTPSARGIQITQPPIVQNVDSNSATISWATNQPSSSRVWYGTNMDDLAEVAEAPSVATIHRVRINSLEPNTTYYFQVESSQARNGSDVQSPGVMSFRTAPQGTAALHAATPY